MPFLSRPRYPSRAFARSSIQSTPTWSAPLTPSPSPVRLPPSLCRSDTATAPSLADPVTATPVDDSSIQSALVDRVAEAVIEGLFAEHRERLLELVDELLDEVEPLTEEEEEVDRAGRVTAGASFEEN